jgi:DNA-binding NarL/FixJ family response regulator
MSSWIAEQPLTLREMLAASVGEGHPNMFVASSMNLAEGTVKYHLRAIFQRLELGVGPRWY